MDDTAARVFRTVLLISLFVLTHTAAIAHGNDNPDTIQPDPNLKFKFDLPSDEFPKAILEFYRQCKIEVLFLADDSLNLIHTKPVIGEYAPREALEIMLKGTGLVYNFATDHSVSVKQLVPPDEPPQPQKTQARRAPIQWAGQLTLTVTGTLIRGAMDAKAPLLELSREDISLAAFPTVQDTLYQQPIVSLDAPRADLGVNNNFNWGSAVNLRSLGVGATLTLVNGHRQPLSGLDGDFVDVANIPAAAVERIEILPQGASAIYGSDAIAGVVNIILKDHFDGAQTSVHYGGSPGGLANVVVSQVLGTHWDSGNMLFVYQYSDATSLGATARGYAANADKRPYGGGDYNSFYTDPGNILNPNTYLPVSGGTGGPVQYENNIANLDLFPQATQHSVYGTGKEDIDNVELFAEGRFTQRSTYERTFAQTETLPVGAANPFNPSPGTTTLVDYSFAKVFGPSIFSDETQNYVGTVGTRFQFAHDWQATLSQTYGQERLYSHEYNEANQTALSTALAAANPTQAFNPFGATNPDVLAAIWENYPRHATTGIEDSTLIGDGSVLSLPSGSVKLALGVERREETLSHSEGNSQLAGEIPITGRYGRHVETGFSEVAIPVIGDPSNQHAAPRLEVSLADRYDRYSDFGGTTNPEFDVRWTPVNWLKLRASWDRSYRAPKLDDLYDTSNDASGLTVFPDPRSPTGQSLVLVMQGNNPHLRPETAKSWTVGFDVVPDFDPDFGLSLTYYSIDYSGQIALPDAENPTNILTQSSEWAAVITRNPMATQIASVCDLPDYRGSVSACLASSPAAIVDFRLANLQTTLTTGSDIDIHQKLSTAAGQFNLRFTGNYVFHFDQKVTDASPSVDILNTFGNPLKFRFRALSAWDRHAPEESGFGSTVAVNFTNAYSNPGSVLVPQIRALTTVDMQWRYHTQEHSRWFGGAEFSLNAVNVFNQSPPFSDEIYGYDRGNFQPLGRVLNLSISKQW